MQQVYHRRYVYVIISVLAKIIENHMENNDMQATATTSRKNNKPNTETVYCVISVWRIAFGVFLGLVMASLAPIVFIVLFAGSMMPFISG